MEKIILSPKNAFAFCCFIPYLVAICAIMFISQTLLGPLGKYVFLISFVPLAGGVYQVLLVLSIRYEISGELLMYCRGVFNPRRDPIEIYRVKDLSDRRSLFNQAINAMDVIVLSSDKTHPELKMKSIPHNPELLVQLRNLVEQNRRARGVREFD